MADLLSLFTWLADKIFRSCGNKTKLCLRLVSTAETELIEKAYRTKPAFPITVLKSITWGRSPML